MTNGSASLAHVLTLAQLLATLKVLLWRRFEARPYVGTEDGETYECIALDLDGAHRDDLPTNVAPTAYEAVQGMLDALHELDLVTAARAEENSAALVAADAERADESGPRTLADGVPTAYVSPDGPAFTVQLEVGLMRAEVA